MIVNGVEITPRMAEALHLWYDCSLFEDMKPCQYVKWLSNIQDYLIRVWVDKDDDAPDLPELKECVSELILIKDDLKMFIPESPNKQQIEE
jgi:hypothetical protein